MKTRIHALVSAIALAFAAAPASAEIVLNGDGTGFVGKGDVQSAFGWNDHAFQANAENLTFRLAAIESVSWICRRINNNNTVNQQRSSTSATIGGVEHSLRYNPQGHITGIHLDGYAGDIEHVYSGATAGSCPANPSGFFLVEDSFSYSISDSLLEVSADGGQTWVELVAGE